MVDRTSTPAAGAPESLPSVASPPGEARLRLHFLDGLRGLSALYVLIFHTLTIEVRQQGTLSVPMRFLRQVFGYGHYAVCIFIVLSGFSLMLPLARAGNYELKGGFRTYIRRRARRLMPPYYAALALSLAAILAYNAISTDTAGNENPYDAALSPGSILSHGLLVHNWSFDWAYRINGPMWSVATEWQIYFLFPFVLLPLWRRLGGTTTLVIAWGATSLLYFIVPLDKNLYWAAPWFIGSFALGMWGALLGFSPTYPAGRFRNLAWGWITAAIFAALATIVATGNGDWPYPVVDGVVSLLALSLIVWCVQRASRAHRPSKAVRFLGSRPVAYLGGFSYSLYLVQHPVLRFVEKALGDVSALSHEQVLIVAFVVGVPFVMFVGWLFSELFEKPFTGGGIILPILRVRLRRGRTKPVDPTAALPATVVAVPPVGD